MNVTTALKARDELDIESLLSLPRLSKLILKGVESHYDAITANVILMHGEMTSLLGPLMYQAAKNLKVKPEVIVDTMVRVLKHVLAICEACDYDLPENDELVRYDSVHTNYLVKQDSILILTEMCMAALHIIHVVHVDMEGMTIWAEEEPPTDLQNGIKTIIIGIRNLGKKHGFTLRDVISKIE